MSRSYSLITIYPYADAPPGFKKLFPDEQGDWLVVVPYDLHKQAQPLLDTLCGRYHAPTIDVAKTKVRLYLL